MYILYVLLFITGIIAVTDWRDDARRVSDIARSEAVATQMSAYHNQAMTYCQEQECAAGPVQPGQDLPWHMRDAGIYGVSIRSVHDGSGLIVTYYTAPGSPIEEGRIADALVTRLKGAANAGRYNLASEQVLRGVFRSGPVSALDPSSLHVPVTVGGARFTDGMPMLATKARAQVSDAGTCTGDNCDQ